MEEALQEQRYTLEDISKVIGLRSIRYNIEDATAEQNLVHVNAKDDLGHTESLRYIPGTNQDGSKAPFGDFSLAIFSSVMGDDPLLRVEFTKVAESDHGADQYVVGSLIKSSFLGLHDFDPRPVLENPFIDNFYQFGSKEFAALKPQI